MFVCERVSDMSFLFGSRKEKVRAPEELVKLIEEAFATLATTSTTTEAMASTGGHNASGSMVGATAAGVHLETGSARGGAAESSGSSGNNNNNNSSSSVHHLVVGRRAAGKVQKAEARAIDDLSRYLHHLKVALYGDNSDSEHYKPAGEELAGVRIHEKTQRQSIWPLPVHV